MSRPILEIREGVGGWIVQTPYSEVPVSLTRTAASGWSTCYEERQYQVEVLEEGSTHPNKVPRRAIRVTVWEGE